MSMLIKQREESEEWLCGLVSFTTAAGVCLFANVNNTIGPHVKQAFGVVNS